MKNLILLALVVFQFNVIANDERKFTFEANQESLSNVLKKIAALNEISLDLGLVSDPTVSLTLEGKSFNEMMTLLAHVYDLSWRILDGDLEVSNAPHLPKVLPVSSNDPKVTVNFNQATASRALRMIAAFAGLDIIIPAKADELIDLNLTERSAYTAINKIAHRLNLSAYIFNGVVILK